MPRKKKAAKKRAKKKKVVKKEEPTEITSSNIPLEDMPLSMQAEEETKKEKEISPSTFNTTSSTPFDMAEKVKPATKPKYVGPIHFTCKGKLAYMATDGAGIWWECTSCRSIFYNKGFRKDGELGDPDDENVTYKTFNKLKRSRRLT
jgi:hypothetical protein